MGRNFPKIITVLEKKGGQIFGTNSGCWFPVGTRLPDPPIEKELHRLSIQIFNCTCNSWTVKNMVEKGFLEPAEENGVFQLTPEAKTHVLGIGV